MESPKKMRERLAAWERRLRRYEAEAEKRLKELAQRGASSRREVEELLAKARAGQLLQQAAQFRARAEQTGNEVLRRFGSLPERAFERMGLVTRPQIAELGAQVSRLSRKLDEISRRARKGSVAAVERPNGKGEDASVA